jgi:hypothetical protein
MSRHTDRRTNPLFLFEFLFHFSQWGFLPSRRRKLPVWPMIQTNCVCLPADTSSNFTSSMLWNVLSVLSQFIFCASPTDLDVGLWGDFFLLFARIRFASIIGLCIIQRRRSDATSSSTGVPSIALYVPFLRPRPPTKVSSPRLHTARTTASTLFASLFSVQRT